MTETPAGAESALDALLDGLLPGDTGPGDAGAGDAAWPPASRAVADPRSVRLGVPEEDRPWLDALADRVAGLPVPDRPEALRRAERDEPERFGRLLRAAYGAYYNSAPAWAAIRRLIGEGPRDEAVHFDPAQVRGVVARGAGARRL